MLPTAPALLVLPECVLVLYVGLLTQLLFAGLVAVPVVLPCADPPDTLFALRT
jgi:hypothetical protein